MNLLRRIGSAIVLLAIIVGALILGGYWVAAVSAIAAVVAAWELVRLGRPLVGRPPAWLLYPLALALAARAYLPGVWGETELWISGAIVVGLICTVITKTPFRAFAYGLCAAVYAGLGIGFFALLDQAHGGPADLPLRLVGVALAGPIIGDTTAYFIGSAFGRHRFFPDISPKKSVEGAVAAAVVTTGVFAGLVPVVLPSVAWWQAALLGAAVTVAAQAGDLAESALKRQAGVKDSSAIIPGHGGLMDRLDSLVLVAPVVYWFARIVGLLA